ncbi:unnamed protein product, partial [Brachionus calyciflorus]
YDENKAIFIDRDPKYFSHVLNYLRNVDIESNGFDLPDGIDLRELSKEAKFYNIIGLGELPKKYVNSMDTKILDENQIQDLLDLCQFSTNSKFKLVYRATIDGFSAANFHQKCDNIFPTLTIIQTTTGEILGGYTEQTWAPSASYKNDPIAFVYSFQNSYNIKYKCKIKNIKQAIYCHTNYGPTFGSDLLICDKSNISGNSYRYFGKTYDCYDLTEQSVFTTREIEVFQKIV